MGNSKVRAAKGSSKRCQPAPNTITHPPASYCSECGAPEGNGWGHGIWVGFTKEPKKKPRPPVEHDEWCSYPVYSCSCSERTLQRNNKRRKRG